MLLLKSAFHKNNCWKNYEEVLPSCLKNGNLSNSMITDQSVLILLRVRLRLTRRQQFLQNVTPLFLPDKGSPYRKLVENILGVFPRYQPFHRMGTYLHTTIYWNNKHKHRNRYRRKRGRKTNRLRWTTVLTRNSFGMTRTPNRLRLLLLRVPILSLWDM